MALLLVFTLLVLVQFLHYDQIFILETLEARQDTVRTAILADLSPDQRASIHIEELDQFHQRVTLGAGTLFRECMVTLKPEGGSLVSTIGAALRPYGAYLEAVQVEGHTDPRNPTGCESEDNWALSSERATAVVRILADSASFREQQLLSAVGRGQYHPVGTILPSDTTEGSLARHRRIELLLQYSDRDLKGAGRN